MIELLPAIDLRGGRAVRLLRGNFDEETVYSDDPVAIATDFAAQGARWLHVVDLDGAREGRPVHRDLIEQIAGVDGLQVEVGGGLRNSKDVEELLTTGVDRVVIGTAAVERPDWLAELVGLFPGKVAVGIDVREGRVATRGWEDDSGVSLTAFLEQVNSLQPAALIFTEISRDGAMEGPDVGGLQSVLATAEVPVIASGGVSSLDDIRRLMQLSQQGPLWGIITGRAVYEGAFTVAEAVSCLEAG